MTTYIDFNTKLAYYIDGGKATITGLGNHSASGVLAIPSKVKETETGAEYTVVAIGNDAFTNCTGLTSVTIGNSVTSIGETAFYGCSGLTAFIVDSNNITYISVDGVLFNKSKTILIQFPAKKTVVLYTIPESVTSIGNGAFAYCTGLTSLTIGSSVTIIEVYAFAYCAGLTSLTIPSSVTSIGETAFYGCSGLTEIIVNSNNQNYISVDGVLFNKNITILIQFPAKKTVGSYTIPESVTSIGNGAFAYCTGLTSLTIGSSVTIIGNAAFLACSKLTSLTIGSGVTSIGNAAFLACTGLTSVTIPASVTTIGNGAFYLCTGVFSAYFFGDYFTESGPAFKGNLDTTIYVRSDAAGWDNTWGGCNVIKSIVKHNYSIYFRKN